MNECLATNVTPAHNVHRLMVSVVAISNVEVRNAWMAQSQLYTHVTRKRDRKMRYTDIKIFLVMVAIYVTDILPQ